MTAGARSPRVVITGVGDVSPIGVGNTAFWNSLTSGRSGVDFLRSIPASSLPCKLAAEISEQDFNPVHFVRHKKFLKVMSRDIQLGVGSAALAMEDAGLERGSVDPDRLGVDFGAGRMSTTPEELALAVDGDDAPFELTRWGEDRMGQICPLWLLRQLPNMPACHISIEHDARGPNNTITSRDSSAILAISEAVRKIERGVADVMIVGACTSNVHPLDIAKFSLFEGLSHRDDDPTKAVRPFDRDRDGTIVGEGAGAFIVERYEHAVARGADIYAEILSVGAGCDGRGVSETTGASGLVGAIRAALRRAELSPLDLGHINAHGKSTQRDDLLEARAYHTAFGDAVSKIPVTALKSYFGHFEAGAGAVELAGMLLSLKHRLLPPTLNYETPDPRCQITVAHDGPSTLRNYTAMSVNRTSIGQSAAVIMRAL